MLVLVRSEGSAPTCFALQRNIMVHRKHQIHVRLPTLTTEIQTDTNGTHGIPVGDKRARLRASPSPWVNLCCVVCNQSHRTATYGLGVTVGGQMYCGNGGREDRTCIRDDGLSVNQFLF